MCSLVGWSLESKPSKSLVHKLFKMAEIRGRHSWGFYLPKIDLLSKGVGTIGNKIAQLHHSRTVVGHTRYATTGAVTSENAHPWRVNNLVGAHNGMVYNHDELNRLYQRECEVDSMHIFMHLYEKLPLEEIDKYGAISYVQDNRIVLHKFAPGELGIAETPNGVIWLSNLRHLRAVLEEEKIAANTYELGEEEQLVFPVYSTQGRTA